MFQKPKIFASRLVQLVATSIINYKRELYSCSSVKMCQLECCPKLNLKVPRGQGPAWLQRSVQCTIHHLPMFEHVITTLIIRANKCEHFHVHISWLYLCLKPAACFRTVRKHTPLWWWWCVMRTTALIWQTCGNTVIYTLNSFIFIQFNF